MNFAEAQRFCELLHVAKYVAGIGYYRGGHLGALQDSLFEMLLRNRDNPFPLLIAVNTHGDLDDGAFNDTFLGKSFVVTPEILWNGMPEIRFRGLSDLVKDWPSQVTLYIAHCGGQLYALELVRATRRNPTRIVKGVYGGSAGRTVSEFTTNAHMDDASVHLLMTQFIVRHCKDLVEERGKDGPSIGALICLTSNYMYEFDRIVGDLPEYKDDDDLLRN